jgi:hypothetical protein
VRSLEKRKRRRSTRRKKNDEKRRRAGLPQREREPPTESVGLVIYTCIPDISVADTHFKMRGDYVLT